MEILKMFTIKKEFNWSMGHRLRKHGSKCFHPHGHEYRAIIEFEAFDLDAQGMVVDFGEMKDIVKPILDALDHAFMYHYDDTIMFNFFQAVTHAYNETLLGKDSVVFLGGTVFKSELPKNFKTVQVDFEPTAENIAQYIYLTVREKTPRITSVEVFETYTSSAKYCG